jgi:hypothetical protein
VSRPVRRHGVPLSWGPALAGLALTGLLLGGCGAAARDPAPAAPAAPPPAPSNLVARAGAPGTVALRWRAGAPRGGQARVSASRVFVDGRRVATTGSVAYTVRGLRCGTRHVFAVRSVGANGAVSRAVRVRSVSGRCRAAVWRPAPKTRWQWQITGKVDESVPARMFDVDLFDARPGEINAGIVGRLHKRGVKVVCYVDTGAWESYRPDAGEFPAGVIGNPTGWNGERWLDIRRAAWPKFAPVIWRRLDIARRLGCDGVEPDQNNPLGNDPGFPITGADQKTWYLEVARQAHARRLSVGMKNGIETIDRDTVAAFDWALNEECFQFQECAALTPFVRAKKAVFQVEYQGDPAGFCPRARALGFNSLKKRLALDAWRVEC